MLACCAKFCGVATLPEQKVDIFFLFSMLMKLGSL